MIWGAHPIVTTRACRYAFVEGFDGPIERIIVVADVPFETSGTTNNLLAPGSPSFLIGRSRAREPAKEDEKGVAGAASR